MRGEPLSYEKNIFKIIDVRFWACPIEKQQSSCAPFELPEVTGELEAECRFDSAIQFLFSQERQYGAPFA